MIRTTVALALVCGTAGAAEFRTLDERAIRDFVIGNTVRGTMAAETRYAEFYDEDGSIEAAEYEGAWSIEDGRMCFDYFEGDPTCYAVARQGGRVLWLRDGEIAGTGAVLDGDPFDYSRSEFD